MSLHSVGFFLYRWKTLLPYLVYQTRLFDWKVLHVVEFILKIVCHGSCRFLFIYFSISMISILTVGRLLERTILHQEIFVELARLRHV